jgi:transcription antitermination factor NusG
MRHHIQIPAFPRYLFVATDGPWTPIRYAPGVADLVWNEPGKPGTVAMAAISALQAAEELAASPLRLSRQWAPGTACVVGNGMFDDVPAVVLQVGKEMATVAMMWFGHLREVAVSLDALSPREE